MACMSTVHVVSLRTHRNQSRRSTTPAMIMIISYVYIEYNTHRYIMQLSYYVFVYYIFIPLRIMLGIHGFNTHLGAPPPS